MTKYKCKVCGAPVSVLVSFVKRSCLHITAGIIADISATATGECKVAGK